MTVDEAVERLKQLGQEHGGRLTREVVEADPALTREPERTAAAAHKLASEPRVACTDSDPDVGWFPYSVIVFEHDDAA